MFELIVAIDENCGISKDGRIPWHIPEELHFFKTKTQHHIVIMGKKTFDSIGKPLKNRLNIVLTRSPDENPYYSNVIYTDSPSWVQSFEPGEFDFLDKNPIKFIIGGAEIYNLFFSRCCKLWITTVRGCYDCDVALNVRNIEQNGYIEEVIESNENYTIVKGTKVPLSQPFTFGG